MAFSKITNAQLSLVGATTQPDQPIISATALKQVFDAPAKQVCAPAHNTLVDELEAGTAAASIGAQAPTGRTGTTVQGVVNSISNDLATVETSMPGLISDEHTHVNKALLDTYTQTETDLASAVADDHTHSNKALLDTYTQTEADLASAVADDHTHSNKTEIDKIGESSGRPTYNGNDIGGDVNNAFKTIKVGLVDIDASGEDTFELVEGSGVTLTPDAANKKVTIEATGGGGGGGGDMTKANYANNVLNPKTVDRSITLFDGTNTLSATIPDLNKAADIQSTYIPSSTGSDKPINGQGVADALSGVQDGTTINTFSAVETALSGIKDGVSIDSFADVESALGDIQDGTTLDSFADVESALSGKADRTEIVHFVDATLLSGSQSYNIANALFKTTSRIVQVLADGGYPYLSVNIATDGICTLTFSAALTASLDVSIGISNATGETGTVS